MFARSIPIAALLLLSLAARPAAAAEPLPAPHSPLPAPSASFTRHVVGVLGRLGCNAGTCHGAVQGKNGFRLSLFGAHPDRDFEAVARGAAGRRLDPLRPERSLLLLKATAQVPHGGGRVTAVGSPEYELLLRWIVEGAQPDDPAAARIVELSVQPSEVTLQDGETCRLAVAARFADGATLDVTSLAAFASRDAAVANVDRDGLVRAVGVGDAAVIVRYRDVPVAARVIVSRPGAEPFPEVAPASFIDEHVLAKLRRLNVPPAGVADDATFLRRARLDVTGRLPEADEVRRFLADAAADKRLRKIDELLADPGHAALWTLKFCDLLRASDYGIYADNLAEHYEAPRFQAWIRARLTENTPYDELAARIVGATSRDGLGLDEYAAELVELQAGYATPRTDLARYARRSTLDIYWQRRDAVGLPGALQVAHAFLGLRLQCAQCHRHPHDVWQQDDLLSFANFYMRVRTVGFQGDNEQRFPDEAKVFQRYTEEGKKLMEQAAQARQAAGDRLAQDEKLRQELDAQERRGRLLAEEVAVRVLHAQVFHRTDADAAGLFASVTNPLGTQSSREFRLLGEAAPIAVAEGEDPRRYVVEWLRRPDNPYFAKAIVNRVWAHYFGRGIIDPPDDLSPFNPPSHPELLDELCRQFIDHGYDLRWLHATLLASRTYQQSSRPAPGAAGDRSNYAAFYLRRMPAEVLLDALDQATGTKERMEMEYYHWPEELSAVELPYKPQNSFVTFVLEQFGRPARNSSVQCDCERQGDSSLLQVLALANHPRVRQKIADPAGRVGKLVEGGVDPAAAIEELYLTALGRMPDEAERTACLGYVAAAETPAQGLQAVLWGLLNTREFVLQH
jgi:hypothetical protein